MALGQGMVTWSYAGLTMCSQQNVVSVGGEDSFVEASDNLSCVWIN